MSDNRYAPPAAAVVAEEPQNTERPPIVGLALKLLWAGFAVSCATSLYNLFIVSNGPPALRTVGIIGALFGLTVAAAICYAVFTAVARGRAWARWVLAVLVVLAVGTLTWMWWSGTVRWQAFASLLVRASLNATALAMLFSPAANAWYREKKRPA